jgi:hypothetical protein
VVRVVIRGDVVAGGRTVANLTSGDIEDRVWEGCSHFGSYRSFYFELIFHNGNATVLVKKNQISFQLIPRTLGHPSSPGRAGFDANPNRDVGQKIEENSEDFSKKIGKMNANRNYYDMQLEHHPLAPGEVEISDKDLSRSRFCDPSLLPASLWRFNSFFFSFLFVLVSICVHHTLLSSMLENDPDPHPDPGPL